MKISVITPSLNGARSLEQSIMGVPLNFSCIHFSKNHHNVMRQIDNWHNSVISLCFFLKNGPHITYRLNQKLFLSINSMSFQKIIFYKNKHHFNRFLLLFLFAFALMVRTIYLEEFEENPYFDYIHPSHDSINVHNGALEFCQGNLLLDKEGLR